MMSEVPRHPGVRVHVLGPVLGILALASPAVEQEADTSASAPLVERRIDVGGYRLNFQTIQGRGPVILLEAGGGLDSTEWADIGPRLARETGATVVAYDRAGFGKSDLPDTPCDLSADTAALWRGLRTLGLDRDLVLVGHSYGGMLIRFEAAEHPEAVRGLVFVDPFTIEFVDRLGVDYCNAHPMIGRLPFDASRPEKLTRLQRAQVRMIGVPSNLGEKVALLRRAVLPQGIPVRLISAGIDFLPRPEEQKAWREAQERFAASVPGARIVVAEKSSHMVPLDQPDLLVSVIAEVTRAAR